MSRGKFNEDVITVEKKYTDITIFYDLVTRELVRRSRSESPDKILGFAH